MVCQVMVYYNQESEGPLGATVYFLPWTFGKAFELIRVKIIMITMAMIQVMTRIIITVPSV